MAYLPEPTRPGLAMREGAATDTTTTATTFPSDRGFRPVSTIPELIEDCPSSVAPLSTQLVSTHRQRSA